jgi:hypothetical protein
LSEALGALLDGEVDCAVVVGPPVFVVAVLEGLELLLQALKSTPAAATSTTVLDLIVNMSTPNCFPLA